MSLAPSLRAAFSGTYRVSHRPRWWRATRVYVSPPQRFIDSEDALLALRDRGYRRIRIERVSSKPPPELAGG
jgi:hypothetical protein